jgi:Flp pilus assembly protein TadD
LPIWKAPWPGKKKKNKARPIKEALDYTKGLYAAEEREEKYKEIARRARELQDLELARLLTGASKAEDYREIARQAKALADEELINRLTGDQNRESKFQYGLRMIREENYQAAVDTFKVLQKKDPNNEYLRFALNYAEGLNVGKNKQSWFKKMSSK